MKRRKYNKRRYRKKSKSPFSELFKLFFDFIKISYREYKEGRPKKAILAIFMAILIIITIYGFKSYIKQKKAEIRANLIENTQRNMNNSLLRYKNSNSN